MTTVSTRLYPGGVTVTNSGANPVIDYNDVKRKLVVSLPDEKIRQLFIDQNSKPVLIDNFEFRKELIECCLRLYGRFYSWIRYQIFENRFIHGNNQAFLVDTLKFIKTGERQMMLGIWSSIIDQYPDSVAKKEPVLDAIFHEFMQSLDVQEYPYSDYISEWVSQKNGWMDMLCTTYLLFGQADNVQQKKFNMLTSQ